MFSLRPPRERSATDSGAQAPIIVTPVHAAIAFGVFAATFLFLLLAAWPTVRRAQERADHLALLRRTYEVQQLLDGPVPSPAAAAYLTRQTK